MNLSVPPLAEEYWFDLSDNLVGSGEGAKWSTPRPDFSGILNEDIILSGLGVVASEAGVRQTVRPGVRLPDTSFAELVADELAVRSSHEIFAGKRVILVGLPAAFSPICSRVHIPGFVDRAPSLLSSGFDMIACISANDPWVLASWARTLDPSGRIRFLSDGNLEFGHACLLTSDGTELFIGTRLKRFSLIVTDCVVERCAVEDSPLAVTCSAADQI